MMARGSRGLTLIELLVAMSIFSVLGIFLFSLMRGSLGIYRTAQGTGEFYDTFDRTIESLSDDLRCTWIGDPIGTGMKVEFLCTHDRKYVPPAGVELTDAAQRAHTHAAGDPRSFLLRFVRTYPGGELNDTIARFAGTYAGGEAYIDGVDDLAESRAATLRMKPRGEKKTSGSSSTVVPGLRAPGGLMEVMYFLGSGPYDKPGTYTLYRATRSPVGGPGSFFDPATLDRMTPEWIEAHASAVVSGIAFFGMTFWSQNTREWNTEDVLDRAGERKDSSSENPWSELWWDSSRAKVSQFGLHEGADSATLYEDDVFPRAARIVLSLVRTGDRGPEALLLGGAKANTKFLRTNNPKLFGDGLDGPRFLKLGDEWVEVTAADGRDLTVKRGVRGTHASKHDDGVEIMVGRHFETVIEIPAHRSWFRSPGEKP